MRLEALLNHDQSALRCPHLAYEEPRAAGVHYSEAANAFVVSGHDDVVAVLRDNRTFSSVNTVGAVIPPQSEMADYVPLLLLSDNPEHARRRSIVNRAFTPGRIASWEPGIHAVCSALADGFADEPEIEFVERFAIPLPITVITRVMGVPEHDAPSFKRWSDELAATVGNHHVDPAEQLRVAKEFASHLDPLLDAAAGREQGDILSIIAAAERAAELTRSEAARFVMELLVAGNITTTHHLSNSMLLLARDPALADRLRQDPCRIPRFVEESLRLAAPIQGFYRLATADAVVGGVAIPEGSRVLVLYGSANHDPAAWPSPETTDLERKNVAGHLAFGRGAHACLGAALARAEGRIALEVLLSRIARFEPAGEAGSLPYVPSAVNHGPERLPLRLTWSE